MLDLDALGRIDDALFNQTEALPFTASTRNEPDTQTDITPRCPHLAGMTAK